MKASILTDPLVTVGIIWSTMKAKVAIFASIAAFVLPGNTSGTIGQMIRGNKEDEVAVLDLLRIADKIILSRTSAQMVLIRVEGMTLPPDVAAQVSAMRAKFGL